MISSISIEFLGRFEHDSGPDNAIFVLSTNCQYKNSTKRQPKAIDVSVLCIKILWLVEIYAQLLRRFVDALKKNQPDKYPTDESVGDAADIDKSSFSKYLTGMRRPNLDNLGRLYAIGMSVNWFVSGGKGPMFADHAQEGFTTIVELQRWEKIRDDALSIALTAENVLRDIQRN